MRELNAIRLLYFFYSEVFTLHGMNHVDCYVQKPFHLICKWRRWYVCINVRSVHFWIIFFFKWFLYKLSMQSNQTHQHAFHTKKTHCWSNSSDLAGFFVITIGVSCESFCYRRQWVPFLKPIFKYLFDLNHIRKVCLVDSIAPAINSSYRYWQLNKK